MTLKYLENLLSRELNPANTSGGASEQLGEGIRALGLGPGGAVVHRCCCFARIFIGGNLPVHLANAVGVRTFTALYALIACELMVLGRRRLPGSTTFGLDLFTPLSWGVQSWILGSTRHSQQRPTAVASTRACVQPLARATAQRQASPCSDGSVAPKAAPDWLWSVSLPLLAN